MLDYDEVWAAYQGLLEWLARTYVDALNCIHYMHDKYAYERLEMALHDGTILRTLACGIAGLSVAADSLSAIKYATVRPVRDASGLVVDYKIEGEYPAFGNDDDRVDEIAVMIVEHFMRMLRTHPAYRGAVHTQSVLTITSNVVYGKSTGNTPDGRRAGMPFAPGANPMNGRDSHGMLASALSVAKLPFAEAQDGISLTTTIIPSGLGRTPGEQVTNLVGILDAYTKAKGYHLNVNVLNRETLVDAMEFPGEVSAADDPGVRLRREFRATHPGAAAGCHQPHVPHQRMTIASHGTVSLGMPRRSCLGVHESGASSGGSPIPAELRHLELQALRTGAAASVHSWELVTAVDGPGTRMTLFLSGCPLRCQYCQNPDTWRMRDGIFTPIEEIVSRLSSYRDLFESTGGGVTVSGGEPLMQSTFVAWLFAECRRLGVHTALDTSGCLGGHASDQLLDDTSLVLLDVKSGTEETNHTVTGRALQPTVEFGDRLAQLGIPVWVRFVLVPGLTDDVDNIDAVARIVARWANVERVEVLRFHQIGRSTWQKLGLDYTLDGVLPPSAQLQERVREQFRAVGLLTF